MSQVCVRLDFEPLRAFWTRRGLSLGEMDRATGINPSRARRGGVSLDQIDRACDILGVHPTAIYGDEWITAAAAPIIPAAFGRAPEPEPDGGFCGRDLEYAAVTRARAWWYRDWVA